MQTAYLEVTYRSGKPFAAYLYLPRRTGDTVSTTHRVGALLADHTLDGRLIGIEIPSPAQLSVDTVNELLRAAKLAPMSQDDLRPLAA